MQVRVRIKTIFIFIVKRNVSIDLTCVQRLEKIEINSLPTGKISEIYNARYGEKFHVNFCLNGRTPCSNIYKAEEWTQSHPSRIVTDPIGNWSQESIIIKILFWKV